MGIRRKAVTASALVLLLLGAGAVPVAAVPVPQGPSPAVGVAGVEFDLGSGTGSQGEGPGASRVPKAPNENTLGYTTRDNDMDVWRKDTDGFALDFTIDLKHFANKDQVRSDLQDGGYWLQLGYALIAYFRIDADGAFDDWRTTPTPPGDEPCHAGRFGIFKVYVNNRLLHTTQGENERPCNSETERTFDIVPFRSGEPANQYRVPVDWVRKGENTVRIELLDAGYTHPQRDAFNDGWWMHLDAAALELVAPPLFISGGWSFDLPPGGHDPGPSGWEAGLATTLRGKFTEHFGQDPWDWAPVAFVPDGTNAGCRHVPAPPGHDVVALGGADGYFFFGKDGKQDFRVTGCQVAKIIKAAQSEIGYNYRGGTDPEGFWYIGFSMGGLIGRWAVQREGLEPSLGKFVTLGTPHKGSHWADKYVQVADLKYDGYHDRNGDGLRHWWGGWRDWWTDAIGARFHEDHVLRPCFSAFPPSVSLCWRGNGALLDHRADFELKPDNPVLQALNTDGGSIAPKTLAVSGQGGDKGFWLGIGIGLLTEGDGVVPTSSATNGGQYRAAFCGAYHHGGSYSGRDECMQPVFEHLTGYLGSSAGALASPQATQLVEAAAGAHQLEAGAGVLSAEEDITLDATPEAVFAAYASELPEALRLTLTSPSGRVYTEQTAADLGADYSASQALGLTSMGFIVPDAEPGAWRLRIELAEDAPTWPLAVLTSVAVRSDVVLTTSGPSRADPGADVVLTATLTGPASGATVTGRAMPTEQDVAFRDDGTNGDPVAGDGVFTALYASDEEGDHVIAVEATGSSPSGSFARAGRIELIMAREADVRVRDLAVLTPPPWWGDEARASVVVENLGAGHVDASVALFDDSDPARTAPLAESRSLALGPGQSATVEVAWVPSPGLRTVRAEAIATAFEERLADNAAEATLDVLPSPRTAAFLAGPQRDGWFVGPVTVTLAPFDRSPPAYARTDLRLDGGAWQSYAGPFPVAADGEHVLEFQSTDAQGRVEPLRTAAFRIDATAPAVSIASPAAPGVYVLDQRADAPFTLPVLMGLVDVALPSSDAASGVARLEVRVDGVRAHAATDPPATHVWRWDSSSASLGRHTLTVTATDRAGHAATASVVVYVAVSRAAQVDNDPLDTLERIAVPVG